MARSKPSKDEYLNRLRLAVEHSLTSAESSRKVAALAGVSHAIVCRVRKKSRETDLGWEAASRLPAVSLYQLLAGPERRERSKELPDFEHISRRLGEPGMTREHLHREHKALYGERALSYSRFCQRLRSFKQPDRATMTQNYQPGYRLEVDFSGEMPWYIDKKGSKRKVDLLCAALPFSGYSFACCLPSQGVDDVIAAMLRALNFIGGAPRAFVPDNFASAVLVSGTEKLRIQADFLKFAQAHNVAVLPARPRSPTHKGAVEECVKRMQRYLLPELARKTYRSFEELDAEVARLMQEYNHLPLSEVLKGTRAEEFASRERMALQPLPEVPYVHRHSLGRVKVQPNHRVRVLNNFYSVPYELVGKRVEIFVIDRTVEVMFEGDVVATHPRLSGKLEYSLMPEHEKLAHQAQRSRGREGIEDWAKAVGPMMSAFITQLFASERVNLQALPAAQAVHSACQDQPNDYLERVATEALHHSMTSATDFKRLLRMMRNENLIDPQRPRLLPRPPSRPPSAGTTSSSML